MASGSPRSDLSVLIPAAGRGERLGFGPKVFLPLNGEPLVVWLVRKAMGMAAEVIVAVPPEHLDRLCTLCPDCRAIEGGATRQASVARLVEASTRPWLLLQDVARPFASADLMRAVVEAARDTGAAGAFLRPEVPIARVQDGYVLEDFRPDQVGIFQAPQAFKRSLLVKVLEQAAERGWTEQSTLQLVLRAGLPVRTVPGEKTNLKLTTEEDLELAVGLLKRLA